MKNSTKVTLIFMVLYLIWNLCLQSRLTTLSVEEDKIIKKLNTIVSAGDSLNQLLENETDKIGRVLKEFNSKIEIAAASRGLQTTINILDVPKQWTEPIPLLVLACNRAAALRAHLDKLIRFRPSVEKFPITVSIDCVDNSVSTEVSNFGSQIESIKHSPGSEEILEIPVKFKKSKPYYYIARHYKLALNHIFSKKNFSSVIITEDDLDIAPDFFSLFSNTRYLLEKDSTLWCVSAWNDNGKPEHIDGNASSTLYRSDFVSGLGWMMTRKTWEELKPKWPAGFWDDWMREPEQRKGRQCIRPEISRTGMTVHGKKGASGGLFFNEHLRNIKLNDVEVDFSKIDLDYLLPENFKKIMEQNVAEAFPNSMENVTSDWWKPEKEQMKFKLTYTGKADFISKAQKLRIMKDFKAGVPRTAYKGIVTCFFKNARIYLIPDRSKVPDYDPSW